MPLNVLAVDVDKLLKHKVKIPAPEPTPPPPTPSIPCGTRHAPVQPETPRTWRGSSTSPRVDCFLIKGDDGQKIWHGAVRRPNDVLSPPHVGSPPSRHSPRHQRRIRRFSIGSSPEDHRSLDESSALTSSAVEDSDLPGDDAFRVQIGWVPTESYRHTHATVVPLPRGPIHSGDDASGGKAASQGSTHAVADSPMSIHSGELPSRPPTDSGVCGGVGGGAVPSSRGSSANTVRQGSARKVRLVGIDDAADAASTALMSPKSETAPQSSTRGQRTPTNAGAKPPLGGLLQPAQSSIGELCTPPSLQHPMSARARDIIHTTLTYVNGRLRMLVQAPSSPQAPMLFRDSDVQRRLLSPRTVAVANGSDGCGCGPHGGRKRVPSDRIIASVDGTVSARQQSIVREKERLLALSVLRHENILTPQCNTFPSTLTTFQRSLQSKSDPMFAAVFDAQYVKPPRTYHTRVATTPAATAARSGRGSKQQQDGSAQLTAHEQSVYNILVPPK